MDGNTTTVTGIAMVGRPGREDPVAFVHGPSLEDAADADLEDIEEEAEKVKAAAEKVEAYEDDPEGAIENLKAAVQAGRDADSFRETLILQPTDTVAAFNLAAGAMTLLITLMIVLLAALVGGKFADAVPSNSTFSEAIQTTTDNAGTAFVIFGVSLLAIPTVAVLAYMITRLGGFIGFSGGMGMGGFGR